MNAQPNGDETMGRKKTAPPSKSVRIYETVYNDAMIVAAYEKKDLTTYISEVLAPIIEEAKLRHSQASISQSKAKPSPK